MAGDPLSGIKRTAKGVLRAAFGGGPVADSAAVPPAVPILPAAPPAPDASTAGDEMQRTCVQCSNVVQGAIERTVVTPPRRGYERIERPVVQVHVVYACPRCGATADAWFQPPEQREPPSPLFDIGSPVRGRRR